jgi:MHS family proline/betaine transporter-like MFS transporter
MIAPVVLLACRLLQGLCVGGEYSGASIFVIEFSKKGKECFAGSVLAASGLFGGVIGTFFGFLCTLSFMPSWGWRIPFLIGSLFGLMGYYIRTRVNESPDFIRAKNEKIEKVPLLGVLQKRMRNLLCTIGIGAASLVPFYLASVYMAFLMSSKLNLSTSEIMLINVILNVFVILIVPLSGLLADKFIGKESQMIGASTLTILTAYPLFFMLQNETSLSNIIFVQVVLMVLNVGFIAPSMALLSRYFPVHERYSGIGFGYALGGALLGGTTPLILAFLTNWLGSPLVPAYYLMFAGLLGIVCVVFGRQEDTSYTSNSEEFPHDFARA